MEKKTVKKQSNKKMVEYFCHKCGVELTEENCLNIESPFCLDCESEAFTELESKNGTSLAFYLSCMRFDVPLYPLLISNGKGELREEIDEKNKWKSYLSLLKKENKLFVNERFATFNDGETKLLRIFGKEFSEKDFARYVRAEMERISALPGTQEQREFWGELPLYQNVPMTTEIYNKLDKRYEARMARMKGVTIDDQLIDTHIKICKILLAQDHVLSLGDVSAFDKLQKSLDSILAAEQLRKKDEKPIEEMRIDSLVVALENAGLMENGELLTYDELVEALRDNLVKSKKYKYSLDVADQVLLDIINSMRANADLMQVIDLPEELELVDEYGEFEKEETEQEKEAKRYLGLTKVSFEKKGEGG